MTRSWMPNRNLKNVYENVSPIYLEPFWPRLASKYEKNEYYKSQPNFVKKNFRKTQNHTLC
jgi:hypothetical protein